MVPAYAREKVHTPEKKMKREEKQENREKTLSINIHGANPLRTWLAGSNPPTQTTTLSLSQYTIFHRFVPIISQRQVIGSWNV